MGRVPPALRHVPRILGAGRIGVGRAPLLEPGGAVLESIEGRVALVTGGSRGIGRACALELARRGCHVCVNYRARAGNAAEVVEEIRSMGRNAVSVQADVGTPEGGAALVGETLISLGGVDIVVNNAGVWTGAPLDRLDPAELDRLIDTNLKGAFHVTAPALPTMKEAGWGRIINMSSVIGVTGFPGDTMYASTKAGLFGFTKALARELARSGITVNAVVPGFIETDMAAETGDETRERILRTIPMRRWGLPGEVAETVAFLCESGAYITGQALTVDGGYTI